jgi:hypothetical protein
VDPPGAQLDHEQHVQGSEPDGLDGEEVGGQDPVCLAAQELPQVGPDRRGAGPSPLRRSSVRIAAAVRSDGLVAAGSNAAYDKDVYIFEPGGSTPIATYEFGHLPDQETWAHTLVDGGLAWGGDRIYAVTHVSSEPDNVTLRVRVVG